MAVGFLFPQFAAFRRHSDCCVVEVASLPRVNHGFVVASLDDGLKNGLQSLTLCLIAPARRPHGVRRGLVFFSVAVQSLAETAMDLPGTGRRVLVIEDSGDSAFILKRLLELYGFEVTIAGSGEVGLHVAQHWLPDAVVLDIGLPDMDGYQVAEALRRHEATARLKIIALSAFDPGTFADREKEARFSARLVKPVAVERLVDHLTKAG